MSHIVNDRLEDDFRDRLDAFVEIIAEVHAAYYAKHLTNLTPPTFEIDPKGRKYLKIVVDNGTQKSVHCFVEAGTGNILKAASWKAPAKHARGNIWDDDGGRGSMSDHGFINYLR